MESFIIFLTKLSEVCSILSSHYESELKDKKILSVRHGHVSHCNCQDIIPEIYRKLNYYTVIIEYESEQIEYKIITA